MTETNAVMTWDDVVEVESSFVTLEAGEYDFIVTELERGYFDGSEKMDACPMATVHFQVDTPNGAANLRENLMLHRKMEWKLSQFFTSIGLKKKGEPVQMDWNKVVGAAGRFKVKPREYDGKTFNSVDEFLAPVEAPSNPSW